MAQYMSNPSQQHIFLGFQVLRYLENTPMHGLLCRADQFVHMQTFTDADFAADAKKHSKNGHVTTVASAPV